MMIKKVKLSCDRMPLEIVTEKLGFKSLIMFSKIPLSSVYP
jgi:hypothetical protein